jgi:hypothetical protein
MLKLWVLSIIAQVNQVVMCSWFVFCAQLEELIYVSEIELFSSSTAVHIE